MNEWMPRMAFLFSNFKKCPVNLLTPDEASAHLEKAGAEVPKLLHDAGYTIFKNEYDAAFREFNISAGLGEFTFLFTEPQLMMAQKLVSYYLDVKFGSIDATLSVTDPEEVLKNVRPSCLE